jgi:hypothetical protein
VPSSRHWMSEWISMPGLLRTAKKGSRSTPFAQSAPISPRWRTSQRQGARADAVGAENPPFGARINSQSTGFLWSSGRGPATQVGHALQAQSSGRLLPLPLATRREEAAQEPALPQFFQPRLPGLGRGTDLLQDLGHFTRDRRLALTEKPSLVPGPLSLVRFAPALAGRCPWSVVLGPLIASRTARAGLDGRGL